MADNKNNQWSRMPSGTFAEPLRSMMYAFGDAKQPLPETVALVEDMVQDYMIETVRSAMEVTKTQSRLRLDDLLFVIRKDAPKLERAQYLLQMYNLKKKSAEIQMRQFDQ